MAFKMKGFSGFGNSPLKQPDFWIDKSQDKFGGIDILKSQDESNMMGTDWQEGETTGQSGGSGNNAKLIQALKKQDEVEMEVDEMKERKKPSIWSGIGRMLRR